MSQQILFVIGVVFVVCGLGALSNPRFFRKMLGSYTANPALIYISGLVNLVIGLILVFGHNIWTSLPEAIVAFFAWAAIIRGIIMLLSPTFFLKLFKRIWMGSHLKGEAFFIMVIGIILIYLAR
ncbi:MAG: hypothetical protein KW793_00815 [Candidatus Doudnabacteria bacterium]|nr:hypothetical protein [Candidatus Doudnabacteria bacterium]